jgi:hypothetical protein
MNTVVDLQLSFFSSFADSAKKKIKKVLCLDCGTRELILEFNEEKRIFEGNRLCCGCQKTVKRKFYLW